MLNTINKSYYCIVPRKDRYPWRCYNGVDSTFARPKRFANTLNLRLFLQIHLRCITNIFFSEKEHMMFSWMDGWPKNLSLQQVCDIMSVWSPFLTSCQYILTFWGSQNTKYTEALYRRFPTPFHRRFGEPPALDACGNQEFPQAGNLEPSVEIDFYRRFSYATRL